MSYLGYNMYVTKTIRDLVIIVIGVSVFTLGTYVVTHPFETGRWLKELDDARFYELDHDTGPALE